MTSKNWIYTGIAIAVVIMLLLILTVRDLPETDPELQEIKIGYLFGATINVNLPLIVAQEKGFFEEEGLKVVSEDMVVGASIPALLAKEVDYIVYTIPALIASMKEAPIKVFMLTGRFFLFHLIAQPDIKLNELNNIGIVFRGSIAHYNVMNFIEEKKLEAEIIDSGGDFFALPALLYRGAVDAIIHETPAARQLEAEGFPILATFDEMLPTGLITRTEKIENNPEEIQKVVRAVQKAMEFIVYNPEETKEFILKTWNLEKTDENLQLAEEVYPFVRKMFDRKDVPFDEGAERLLQIAKVSGMFEALEEIEKQVVTQEDIEKAFDFRFVK